MKETSRWFSERVGEEVTTVRWGAVGTPVLIFPTAGGDAEEIERFYVIDVLSELMADRRIKIYSCDSVAGRAMLGKEGHPHEQMALQRQFHEFVYHELVPAIRQDCQTADIEVIAAGASIGAFNAVAVTCRFPDVFRGALCLSGTYDLRRFLEASPTPDLLASSPLDFLPHLSAEHLDRLRQRFILIAAGQGRAEDLGESWRLADALGRQGIPNRVDPWDASWHHDWVTWRKMFPHYLDELTVPATVG